MHLEDELRSLANGPKLKKSILDAVLSESVLAESKAWQVVEENDPRPGTGAERDGQRDKATENKMSN